jgi:hypothetical protein
MHTCPYLASDWREWMKFVWFVIYIQINGNNRNAISSTIIYFIISKKRIHTRCMTIMSRSLKKQLSLEGWWVGVCTLRINYSLNLNCPDEPNFKSILFTSPGFFMHFFSCRVLHCHSIFVIVIISFHQLYLHMNEF